MPKSAPCEVIIEDRGDVRVVEIRGPHFEMGDFRPEDERFETTYSVDLLELIQRVKGCAYFKDEIVRAEDPRYILEPLREAILPITPLAGKRILDFGSGGGASAVCLCRLGATSITGVDVSENAVAIARLRARDCGFAERNTFHRLEDTSALPFNDGAFDLILCHGVIEHIPPERRQAILADLWRVLALSGHLFIIETPNALWPIDRHTTGLPLVPYLPLGLARFCATRLSRRVKRDATVDKLIEQGIRGGSYFGIRRALPGAVYVPNDDLGRYFRASTYRNSAWRKAVKRGMLIIFRFLDLTICRLARVPVAAFLPFLSLCFRKPEDKPGPKRLR